MHTGTIVTTSSLISCPPSSLLCTYSSILVNSILTSLIISILLCSKSSQHSQVLLVTETFVDYQLIYPSLLSQPHPLLQTWHILFSLSPTQTPLHQKVWGRQKLGDQVSIFDSKVGDRNSFFTLTCCLQGMHLQEDGIKTRNSKFGYINGHTKCSMPP